MPFSDFPVFHASPCREPVKVHRASRRLPLPFRVFTYRFTAGWALAGRSSHCTDGHLNPASPPERFLLYSA
jgi:hypothetical protein